MMALQLKQIRPNILKLAYASSRTCAIQVEATRDDWKLWTDNTVLQHANRVSCCQLSEVEKALSDTATKLQRLLNHSQRLVFGPQHNGVQSSEDGHHLSVGKESRRSKTVTPDASEECSVTVNYFDNQMTEEMAMLLRQDKPSHKDLESLMGQLGTTYSQVHRYTYSADDISVPGSADRFYLKAHSAKMLSQSMLHLGGDALDKLFYMEEYNYATNSLEEQKYRPSESVTSLESALLEKEIMQHTCTYTRGLTTNCPLTHQVASLKISPAEDQLRKCEGRQPEKGSGPNRHDRPNFDQLQLVQDHLAAYMPQFFVKRHEYRIYTSDVVFENNFGEKSYTTVGVKPYSMEVAKVRLYLHFKYANVRVDLLSSDIDEDGGTVTVRWRLSGIPQMKAFMFWKFLPWKYKKSKDSEAEWIDGISTFTVDGAGYIAKHTLDKMMIDKNPDEDKKMSVEKLLKVKLAGAAAGTL